MERRRDWQAMGADVLLVALVSGGMLGVAGVLYEWVNGTHAGHASVPGGVALPVVVDFAGAVAAFLIAAQVMSGYGLFRVHRGAFHRVHLGIAWSTLALAGGHAAGGLLHTLQPPIETLPVVLCYVGAAIAVIAAPQVLQGRRLALRGGARARTVHIGLALLVTAVVLGHVVLGVVHSVSG